MKKKYIGKSENLVLLNGKIYDVLSVENGWYRIVDESGEDYLYPSDLFSEPDVENYVDITPSNYIEEQLARNK